ncbi:hypothetical protein E2C01_096228 [Portunus trituberculatus]|uniref:Uncharacterized protein n=1 Tax=Portunus trituberculatus TaxID=210409 RepID=A0A5B7K286_PORTR|nr:hypothetical protein [Portunus trituberculatus]
MQKEVVVVVVTNHSGRTRSRNMTESNTSLCLQSNARKVKAQGQGNTKKAFNTSPPAALRTREAIQGDTFRLASY